MLFLYPEVISNILEKIARPGALDKLSISEHINLVKSLGYLNFKDENVLSILKALGQTRLNEDERMITPMAALWAQAVVNLRLYESDR